MLVIFVHHSPLESLPTLYLPLVQPNELSCYDTKSIQVSDVRILDKLIPLVTSISTHRVRNPLLLEQLNVDGGRELRHSNPFVLLHDITSANLRELPSFVDRPRSRCHVSSAMRWLARCSDESCLVLNESSSGPDLSMFSRA